MKDFVTCGGSGESTLVTFGGSGGSTLLTFVKDFVTFGDQGVNFGDLCD